MPRPARGPKGRAAGIDGERTTACRGRVGGMQAGGTYRVSLRLAHRDRELKTLKPEPCARRRAAACGARRGRPRHMRASTVGHGAVPPPVCVAGSGETRRPSHSRRLARTRMREKELCPRIRRKTLCSRVLVKLTGAAFLLMAFLGIEAVGQEIIQVSANHFLNAEFTQTEQTLALGIEQNIVPIRLKQDRPKCSCYVHVEDVG